MLLVSGSSYSAEALHGPVVISASDYTEGEQICLSPGCIHTASKVLEYMDPNVDPCDDFYEFTCGNFLKKTTIPDDKSSVTSFSLISDTLQEQLRSMIEEPIQPNEPQPFQLTKKLYKYVHFFSKFKVYNTVLANYLVFTSNAYSCPKSTEYK